MGTYVDIDKIFERDGMYCYKVSPSSSKCDPFFIAISPGAKEVYFYKDDKCLYSLGCVDFDNDQDPIEINDVPSGIAAKAAARVYMAAKKGEFPNSLGIYS